MNQTYSSSNESEKNSKLLKGVVIGGLVGGVISLLDSSTRSTVKETALGLKSTSKNLLNEVKENPGEVKEQMISQFKEASNILKDAITDAQSLYERLNNDIFGKMGDVKEITNSAMSTAKDVTGDLKQIGSKVADAGSELKAVVPTGGSSTSSSSSYSSSDMGTGTIEMSSGPDSLTLEAGLGTEDLTSGTLSDSSSDSTSYGLGNSVNSTMATSGDATSSLESDSDSSGKFSSKDKSGGLGKNNSKGKHTLGGQETPNHDKL
ncbi:hypothetical protein [Neobacillus terrae]|uniref:hypothetical protein n=1 Tax=Neobacillus terrae TaxID=3034837 RepID=UPI0014072C21|nr:hypothetical protein [Neobacillus terrae]NHM31486.1 hypothetical protein [Neobacillus terrae]